MVIMGFSHCESKQAFFLKIIYVSSLLLSENEKQKKKSATTMQKSLRGKGNQGREFLTASTCGTNCLSKVKKSLEILQSKQDCTDFLLHPRATIKIHGSKVKPRGFVPRRKHGNACDTMSRFSVSQIKLNKKSSNSTKSMNSHKRESGSPQHT